MCENFTIAWREAAMQCGDLRMDLKTKPKLFALLGAIAVVAQPVQLLGANGAENIVQVPLGGAEEVDAHGICRKILNEGTNTILVPVRSAEEWSSGENAFLNNIAGMSGSLSRAAGRPSSGCTSAPPATIRRCQMGRIWTA